MSTRISGDEQSSTCLYYWQIELRRGHFVQKKTLNKIHENVKWQTIIMKNVIWIWMKTIHEQLSDTFLMFQNAVIGNGAINIYGDRDAQCSEKCIFWTHFFINLSKVYDKKINTWTFPYHPCYYPSTHIYQPSLASRADIGVSDDSRIVMEKVMY